MEKSNTKYVICGVIGFKTISIKATGRDYAIGDKVYHLDFDVPGFITAIHFDPINNTLTAEATFKTHDTRRISRKDGSSYS